MRRLLQVRMLVVLLALALIPAGTLPFAERLRLEWTRFWEPKARPEEPATTLMVVDGFGSATPLLSSADLSSAERAARQATFLRAMEQVELADIPLPDEPPLGYPDAARWAELIAESEARKAGSTTSADDR